MNDEPPPDPVRPRLGAFGGYGIELEYMIVDSERLSVLPIADRILRMAGNDEYEVHRGLLGWSNELVLHVIEIKNPRPVSSLAVLPQLFQGEVRTINELLKPLGARLMPAAMHPWMDPLTETRLWPHQHHAIYQAYRRIFDTSSHGWANLQSMHINLPFSSDAEFARVHTAVRLVLPILPALAASSPVADGRDTGFTDYRMQVYWGNSDKVPSITGQLIPEPVSDQASYEKEILAPMYRDIAPFDPEGILRHEWLNSRGAIARFDRSAIEIRVVDTQECPQADLAVAAAASYLVRKLYAASEDMHAAQQAIPTDALAAILCDCIRAADQTVIENDAYLATLDYPDRRCTANELWSHLIGQMEQDDMEYDAPWKEPLQHILRHGPLARRLLRAVDADYSPGHLQAVWRELCDCLQEGRLFLVAP